MVRTPFLLVKQPDCISLIHNVSLKSAPNSSVYVIGRVTLFVDLGHLHVCVHFDELFGGTPTSWEIIHHQVFQELFPMKRHIFTTRTCPGAVIMECKPVGPRDCITERLVP